MQVETAVAGSHIKFVAFDNRDHLRFHAIEREIETVVTCGGEREGEFALADRPFRRAVAVVQDDLLLSPLPMPKHEYPLTPADRHPARGSPRRIRLGAYGVRFVAEDRRHGRAKVEIAWRRG